MSNISPHQPHSFTQNEVSFDIGYRLDVVCRAKDSDEGLQFTSVASLEVVVVVETPARKEEVAVDEEEVRTVAWSSGIVWVFTIT